MAALKILLALLVTGAAAPAEAEVSRWSHHIEDASARFGVPAAWIARVMHAESRGRTEWAGKPTTSPAGAMGLMQLMPGTWTEMRARLQLGDDPHQPRDNIMAGTLYLRLMYERFGYPGLFAAYNAGPARYAQHIATGKPLPRETRDYVARIAGDAAAVSQRPPSLPSPGHGLFFPLRNPEQPGAVGTRGDLFVRRLRDPALVGGRLHPAECPCRQAGLPAAIGLARNAVAVAVEMRAIPRFADADRGCPCRAGLGTIPVGAARTAEKASLRLGARRRG